WWTSPASSSISRSPASSCAAPSCSTSRRPGDTPVRIETLRFRAEATISMRRRPCEAKDAGCWSRLGAVGMGCGRGWRTAARRGDPGGRRAHHPGVPDAFSACIDQLIFGPTAPDLYWSASNANGGAWGVFFFDGTLVGGVKVAEVFVRGPSRHHLLGGDGACARRGRLTAP